MFTISLNANSGKITVEDSSSVIKSSHDINPISKREKGNSLLKIPRDYTVIDLETTGLSPHWDDIIEISCLKFRDSHEISRYHSLIKPPNDNMVDEFITNLTGITNEMLLNAPSFKDISKDLWGFLSGELIVGHNVHFDINFLYDNFQTSDNFTFDNDFVDTLRIAKRILPNLINHKLSSLTEYFHIDLPHHRAVNDCLATNLVLQNLSSIIDSQNIKLPTSSSYNKKDIDLRTIHGDEDAFSEDHIFYNKNCVFTGKLNRLPRKDAAQLVANIGGHCENNITQNTNFLIIGSFDYVSSVKDNKSNKVKKAERLILEHQDLQIISEDVFYDILADYLA